MRKLVVLIAALTLTAAACGGGEDDAAGLPVNDGDETPIAAGACLEGEPDCNDIPGDEPTDLPPPNDAVVGGGLVVDGGLTVSDALQTDATGVIAVQGFVVAVADEVRLCEALAESFPPQCGGPSLLLDSLDTIDPDELKTEGDVTWTDLPQTVLGEINGDQLNTTALSQ